MLKSSDSRVRELADRYWDRFLELEPLFATQVGDERFDDRLPDPSAEGLVRQDSVHRTALSAAGLDRDELSEESRMTLDVVETLARNRLSSIEHRFDRFDAADHMWGPGTILAQIGSVQRSDTPERLE